MIRRGGLNFRALFFPVAFFATGAALFHSIITKQEPDQQPITNMKGTSVAIDVLTATASHLEGLLRSGAVTSIQLVDLYLAQIEKHNRKGAKLHAMISVVDRDLLIPIAKTLDDERSASIVRGPLHGIPIVIKDSMCTGPQFNVPTTSGTIAFKHAIASKSAPCVEKFIAAGAIILGKANLSVMAGMKGLGCTTGWSEVEGQTQSAYVKGGVTPGDTFLGHSTPGGSSSGSAVAVSAGFAPISLGTETDGSIMAPADRASLYGLKVTPGLFSTEGTLPFTPFSDSVGPLAKSALDIANMLTVWHDGSKDYTQFLNTSWQPLKIGFLDPIEWKSSVAASEPMEGYVEQVAAETAAVADKISQQGGSVRKWVKLRRFGADGDNDHYQNIEWHDYAAAFAGFASHNFEAPPVRTIQELIDFNNAHANEALPPNFPNQDILRAAATHKDDVSDSAYADSVRNMRHNNQEAVEVAMAGNDIDIIIGAPTGRFPTIAAAAGYPCVTLPLGYSNQNGRAFGLMGLARANREDLLVTLASAWEATFGPAKPPPQLADDETAKI